MPNINVLVQAAASVISTGSSTHPDDGELVQELFNCIGLSEQGTENLLDAVTGLSGSGPAYVSHLPIVHGGSKSVAWGLPTFINLQK